MMKNSGSRIRQKMILSGPRNLHYDSGPRNCQKIKISGPKKHHYGPSLFLAPEIFKMGLFLAQNIVNMTKRTFMSFHLEQGTHSGHALHFVKLCFWSHSEFGHTLHVVKLSSQSNSVFCHTFFYPNLYLFTLWIQSHSAFVHRYFFLAYNTGTYKDKTDETLLQFYSL